MTMTHWPLYGLRLRTPRLELRLPDLAELDALAALAAGGVHDPADMPFLVPWTDLPPDERARSVAQYHWRALGAWTPESWELTLAVFAGGEVVGSQGVSATAFRVVREVATGSWLGLRHQGRGFGTEMRAAVLHLAFAGLGAESATSAALADNAASVAVSRRLGYRDNGVDRVSVRDVARLDRRFVLDRDGWARHRAVPVEVEGLAAGLPLFGAEPGAS